MPQETFFQLLDVISVGLPSNTPHIDVLDDRATAIVPVLPLTNGILGYNFWGARRFASLRLP